MRELRQRHNERAAKRKRENDDEILRRTQEALIKKQTEVSNSITFSVGSSFVSVKSLAIGNGNGSICQHRMLIFDQRFERLLAVRKSGVSKTLMKLIGNVVNG